MTIAAPRRRAASQVDNAGARPLDRRPRRRSPAVDVDIEPDLSNAAPFLAAALVAGGTVTIEGWPDDDHPGRRTTSSSCSRCSARPVTRDGGALTVDGGAGIRAGRAIPGVDLDLSTRRRARPGDRRPRRARRRPEPHHRHRPPPRPRDRPPRGPRRRDQRPRRRGHRTRRRPRDRPAPAARRPLAQLRGPPDGDRRRDHRPRRRRASRSTTSGRPPRRCRSSRSSGADRSSGSTRRHRSIRCEPAASR